MHSFVRGGYVIPHLYWVHVCEIIQAQGELHVYRVILFDLNSLLGDLTLAEPPTRGIDCG